MVELKIDRVDGIELDFGEGLAWDGEQHRLYFVDAIARRVHSLDVETGTEESITLGSLPTVVRLTDRAGQVVIATGEGLELACFEAGSSSILAGLPNPSGPQMNDATIDSWGRLVTGHLYFGPETKPVDGAYWSFSLASGWRRIDTGKGNTNGPCFSPDESRLYIADSSSGLVYSFGYDVAEGTLTDGRVFADYQMLGGKPDGAKVDCDGCLWSVVYGGARLARFTPDGRLDRLVELPTNYATDVVFGHTNLDVAYLTTVGAKLGELEPEGDWAGCVLRIENLGVQGLPLNRLALGKPLSPSAPRG